MENEPGQSGIRQCPVCGKFFSQSDFKENSCLRCWKWFFFNCDEYFHKDNKNICSNNCGMVGMLLSCNSCRLKKFLETTKYRCGQRQCVSCGCRTVINDKSAQCSCCRVLAAKKCTCSITTIPCSWCVNKASSKNNNNVNMESFVVNSKKSCELISAPALLPNFATVPSMLGFRTKTPAVEMAEHCDTPQTTIHIDLSLLPEHLQAKAKAQVLGNCYVRIQDLSSTILKKSSKEQDERKGKKRSRSGSFTRNDGSFANAKISSQDCKVYKQKASKERDSPDYSVKNVSDTRLILRLGMEHHDADTESHIKASHHIESYSINNEKSIFPRKNHQVKAKFPVARNNFVSRQEPKSDPKFNGDPSWRAVVDKSTQTEPILEIECLQRRINELELIIAASRSCLTPSPLGALVPQKSSNDPAVTLSTPPNSDSGSNTKNETPVKSPCVLVNRLTKDVLEHYGINRNSSVSPTDEPRPKKRPRLNSVDAEHRSARKPDKKNGGTKKVFELFGDDSEEDISTSKVDVRTSKSQPFDFDELDYDDDEDEESRSSKSYSVESQPMNKHEKTNEMDRHDKSSKVEKKDKNSGKDKRKEKERKKRENSKSKTSDIPKPSKALKEKGQKEITKSQKDQTTVGNSNKFRIPKLAATVTVGLPPLLQENLDLALKTPASALFEEGVPSRTPEPEPAKNLVVKSSELHQITSNEENTIEPAAPISSFQTTGKVAPPILCILPKNRNNKSVNFPEQLATVRSISPRTQLYEHEQVPGDPSRETYIPAILEDLQYVPESSPREPVKGIRPFHPPVRKFNDEKAKSLHQERGGKRFIYSSSSSSSSDSESSENESKEENESVFNYEKSTNQTSPLTAAISRVDNQLVSNGFSAIQQNGSALGRSYFVQETMERACLSPSGSIASDIPSTTAQCAPKRNAVIGTEDTARTISHASESEENVECTGPEKSHLSSLAVPSSPRRHSPEPIPQVSTVLERAGEAQDSEEDDSEDGDVLDIGLNDEEIFDYDYNEDEQLHELPTPKLLANKVINESTRIVSEIKTQPIPPNTATTSNKTNIPPVQVKPPIRSTIPTTSQPTLPRDEQSNSRGLCYSFIRTGKCAISDQANKKCDYSHCIDSVLVHIQYLCNKKGICIQTAYRLVCAMTNVDSPLNRSLCKPIGSQIVGTVIHAFVKENRQEQLLVALEMLNNRKLPLVTEFIDQIIQQIHISSPPIAKKLVTLYERCEFENVKISLYSFNKIIVTLVNDHNLKGWDFICKVVEFAIMYYPQSYYPTNEMLVFLFSTALDQPKLERVCHLFKDFGPPVLVKLGPQRRDEVLNRLRDFGLVDWYDRYSGIVRRPMGNDMHSQFVAQQYAPNGMINLSSHDPRLPLHRAQSSMPPQIQTNPFQPPFRPPLHTNWPQMPNLPRTGHHRPSSLAVPPTVVHRVPPPGIPPVGLCRSEPPPFRVDHPVVNGPPPSVPVACAIRNHAETSSKPTSNRTAPTKSEPLMPSVSVSPTRVVPLPETNPAQPFVPLEVPKPSQSLSFNLFEPESPEVEPVFEDSEPEQGPSVVVEPSYGTEEELLTEFKNRNFEAVTRLFLQYYSESRRCPMLLTLARIVKTNPLYEPEENRELSPGDIFIYIISCACEKGSAETLERRHQKALLDLVFFVLLYYFQNFNDSDEDEKITHFEIVKQFIKMVRLFQLPLENSIDHPELLLFLAECFVQVDFTKNEEEYFCEGVVDDICCCINFLIEFHEVVAKLPVNAFNPNLVDKEFALSNAILQVTNTLEGTGECEMYRNEIAGAMVSYQDALMKNQSRFAAILASRT